MLYFDLGMTKELPNVHTKSLSVSLVRSDGTNIRKSMLKTGYHTYTILYIQSKLLRKYDVSSFVTLLTTKQVVARSENSYGIMHLPDMHQCDCRRTLNFIEKLIKKRTRNLSGMM
uniref:Uncharacterized protein n=1 Tax=Cacopsylla melanoneura TaxID=428564 RepID=A0A8D8U7A5_9HEMI